MSRRSSQAGNGESGSELQEATRRLQEAELAAKVGSRRAAAAEAEVEKLQRQLLESEKRVESLSWQVSCTNPALIQLHRSGQEWGQGRGRLAT